MRRLWLALAFALAALGATPASAQNVVCPTAPVGDNTNKCASTAFVQQAISGGVGIAVGTTTVNNGTDKYLLYDNAGVLGEYAPSGTGTVIGTTSGPLTGGDCVEIDADGNLVDSGAACGTGTVTSVGLSAPGIFSVTGSPVTTNGLITLGLATQSANTVWAGPSSGAAAAPTFRALVGADLPAPSPTSLGGIESYAAVAHQWINAISTSGVPSSTQPSCGDLSDAGTGCSSAAPGSSIPATVQGDILYASGANTLAALAKSTSATRYLSNAGTSNNPAWAQVDLSNGVTGTLPVSSGGTGLASGTSGGVLYFSGSTTLASSAVLAANQLVLGGGAGSAPATLGSLGSSTTVLHGNASGAPSFGAVVSADLNITSTSCTNQFVTAISSSAAGTCTTATLASAQFANQGTATTVLHGNASGNPSWAQVAIASDVSGLGTGVATFLGTPSSANLASAVTDETGSGALVFAGSPALTGTPTFAGSTSGTTGLKASDTASGTLTLPAATDTLVGKATTDTFTNKTYDTAGTGNVFKLSGTQVTTASSILDIIGSTQGDILYRDASGWSVLAPGTSGQVLTTGGSGANPSWATVSGTGTVTSVTCGTGLTGGTITTSGTCAVDIATTSNIYAGTSNKILDAGNVFNSAGTFVTLTDAATIAVDFSTGFNFVVTLAGNRTLGNPSNAKLGQTGCIVINQDATGGRTLAYGSGWKFAGGVAPTLTTTANATDMLCYIVHASNFIIANLVNNIK